MEDRLMIEKFIQTVDIWIDELDRYSIGQLYAKPAPDMWSLGQLYMHLIDATSYFLEQTKVCASGNDNELETSAPEAKTMFLHDEFPDELIVGPPSNDQTPQPENKKHLMDSLMQLRAEIDAVGDLIITSAFRGKTKHPGLNYFNAREWFRFADMHMRHHLRQKSRIDAFLTNEQWIKRKSQ